MPGWQGSINPDRALRAFERELISNEKRQIFAINSFGKCPAGNIFFSFRLCYAMRKEYPHSELFWSAFSRIWTEYGEVLHISPYSVRTQENANQNNSEYGHFSRSVLFLVTFAQIDSLMEKKLEKCNV